jgi:hypothetical protein
VLGVAATASDAEIRTAYLDLVKKHHPDRATTYIQKLAATRKLQEVNGAYARLRDPAQRAAYDLKARSTLPQAPHHVPHRRPRSARQRAVDRFFLDEKFSRVRKAIGIGLFLLGWTLSFWYVSQPPPPHHGGEPSHLAVRVFMSALLAPVVLGIGFGLLMGYVLYAVFLLMVPVWIFTAAWEKATQKPTQVSADITMRLLFLAVACGIAALYWLAIRVNSLLLASVVAFLGWPMILAVPVLLIELMALLVYRFRRSQVLIITNELARIAEG